MDYEKLYKVVDDFENSLEKYGSSKDRASEPMGKDDLFMTCSLFLSSDYVSSYENDDKKTYTMFLKKSPIIL